MKLLLTTLILGVIVVIILYFTHQGVFYKKHDEEAEISAKDSSSSTDVYYHNLPPNLFIDVLQNDDSNYIAGVFHNATFERERGKKKVMFKSNDDRYNFQTVYSYDDIPFTLLYVLINKWQAEVFLDSIKSCKGSVPISEEKYPSFYIGKTYFVNQGFDINNQGFTFKIFNSEKAAIFESKRIQDSITQKSKREKRTLDSIRKAKRNDDPFE